MIRIVKYCAVLAILTGVLLPPAMLVNMALPVIYRAYAPGYIQGLCLLKAFLCGGGILLWFHARWAPEFWRPGVPDVPPPAFAHWEYVVMILLGLGSVALRLPGLDGSLTFDEVFLVRALMTQNPIKMFFHPSGSSHLLHTLMANGIIRVFEPAAWTARLPAFLLGACAPVLLYLAIRRVLSRQTALIAALLLAITPIHVWYSQEAKGNSPLIFGVILAWWFISRLTTQWNTRNALGYLAALVAIGMSHLSGIMYVGVVGMALAILPRRARAWLDDTALSRKVIILHLIALWMILLVYAPILSFLVKRGGAGYLTEGAPRFMVLGCEMLSQFTMLDQTWPWLVAPALLLAVGAIIMWRSHPGLLVLLTLSLVIDLGITVAFKLFSFPRYHMYFLPAATVVMAAGVTGMWRWAHSITNRRIIVTTWLNSVVSDRPRPAAQDEKTRSAGQIAHEMCSNNYENTDTTNCFRWIGEAAVAAVVCVLVAGYGIVLHHYYILPKSNYAAAARLLAGHPDANPVYVVGRGRKGYPASGLVFYTNRFETDDTIGPVLQKTDPHKRITVIVIDPLHVQVSYPDLWRTLQTLGSPAIVWPCHGELDQYRVRCSLVFEIPAGTIAALPRNGKLE